MKSVIDSVKQAVVVARESASAEQQLVAYLVSTGKPVVTVSELRTFLNGILPDYMIPSVFVTVDALPQLPGGKVDRQALPVSISSRPKLQTVFVAPRTRAEEIVAGIWSEVLSLDEVELTITSLTLGDILWPPPGLFPGSSTNFTLNCLFRLSFNHRQSLGWRGSLLSTRQRF